MILGEIQTALRDNSLDGWLFFDHHRRDPIAYRILEIPDTVLASRRWYFFIPAKGKPQKLVHRIESGTLDSLPGAKHVYSSWQEQQSELASIIRGCRRVAMQYSPRCAIPYVSMVDAGTIELVRELGVELVSSADLIQEFESVWSHDQLQMHLQAGKLIDQVRGDAFSFVRHRVRAGDSLNEYEVQQFISGRFAASGLYKDHGPIVAVNRNASDPHYEPTYARSSPIRMGDLVLIDLWAKLVEPDAVYYDVTWAGYCGDTIPEQMSKVFNIVRDARFAASTLALSKAAAREPFAGFEVDDAARSYIQDKGFGEFFFHRTGHNIGTEVHGTGANMDNLESHDERTVIPGSCFSVEPGIYLPEFGIRSEVNVFVGDGFGIVTGEQQENLINI